MVSELDVDLRAEVPKKRDFFLSAVSIINIFNTFAWPEDLSAV